MLCTTKVEKHRKSSAIRTKSVHLEIHEEVVFNGMENTEIRRKENC